MARRPTPWYRHARGAWFVQIDGRQVNLGPDKKAAFDRFYELMRQPREQTVRSDSLAAIIDAFLEWTTNHRSAATYEWYRYRLQRFIERYPDLRADEIRPYHVETWADGYCHTVTSRRNYLRTVKRCMKWAKRQGYIDRNPIVDLEVPRGEHKEVCVSPEEYATLLSYVRDNTLRELLEVTWETGCRPQESLRVEARHVDVANQRWVFEKSESKGKRVSRVVYLTDKAMAITKRLMDAHPSGRLFCKPSGKPWTPMSVNTAISAIQVRMGRARLKETGEQLSEKDIAAKIKTLRPTRTMQGETVQFVLQQYLGKQNTDFDDAQGKNLGEGAAKRGARQGKARASIKTEILFLERVHSFLKPGTGRAAVVVPDGILTNSSLQGVRDWLLEHFELLAVVSLPQFAFQHYDAGVKASIIFVRRLKNGETVPDDAPIFMALADNIGYDGTGRKTFAITVEKNDPGHERIERQSCDLFDYRVTYEWSTTNPKKPDWSERRREIIPDTGLVAQWRAFQVDSTPFFV